VFDCKNRRFGVSPAPANAGRFRRSGGYHLAPVTTTLVQLISLLLAAPFAAAQGQAPAAPATQGAMTQSQAKAALDTLKDPAQRAKL